MIQTNKLYWSGPNLDNENTKTKKIFERITAKKQALCNTRRIRIKIGYIRNITQNSIPILKHT